MNDKKNSRQEVEAYLGEADIPVLLMVLVHLTGERKWIEAPYLPARDLAFFPDASGGLSDDLQSEIRAAACDAILTQLAGDLEPPPPPSRDTYLQMMRVFVGEQIPSEYLDMMLEEMRFQERDADWSQPPAARDVDGFKCLIVGAGMSGLCAAIKFDKTGIPFDIVDKNAGLGGTWFENKYPGVGCDVPNHFYSYSFWPKTDWTEYFSSGAEIETYFNDCADAFGITPKIQFERTVLGAEFDPGRSLWQVSIADKTGEVETRAYNAVIVATGQLNLPKMPDIPGVDTFQGTAFHSARWPTDLSLAGKKVAVIGTGASAMQLAPSVAEEAAELAIFQRSAQWAIPTRDYHRTVSLGKKWLLKNVPFYAEWFRFGQVWRYSDQLLATVRKDPDWLHPERAMNAKNDRHREVLTNYMREQLGNDAALCEKALPDYPPYGKRILVDNNWFTTLRRRNVDLVIEPISHIDAHGVVTGDGTRFDADVIVYATGFNAAKTLGDMRVYIKGGPALNDVWGEEDPRAYLGITVPGFPNLFFLYGPNANLGHGGSIIFISELQVRYILTLLMKMIEGGIKQIDCLPAVHDTYNQLLDDEHAELIWMHPGMGSWYKNKKGRIVSIMPWRLVDYWHLTHDPTLDDYRVKLRGG